MAKGKKGFMLYADLMPTLEKMPDDKAGILFKHILRYVNDLNPTTDDLIIDLTFEPIKQQLKRDLLHWEEVKAKRSDAGKASAIKKQQMLTCVESVEQTETKSTVIVNDNVIDNVSVNDSVINETVIGRYTILDFESFWSLYDKKVGDKTKLAKRFESISESDRVKIKSHIPEYIKAQPDKKYRKDPATYLNNKSWNDEIIQSTPKLNTPQPPQKPSLTDFILKYND